MRGSIKFIEENSDWIYVKEVYAFSTRMQLLDSLDCCRITHSCTPHRTSASRICHKVRFTVYIREERNVAISEGNGLNINHDPGIWSTTPEFGSKRTPHLRSTVPKSRNSKLHETPCICIAVCRQGVLFLRMFVHV